MSRLNGAGSEWVFNAAIRCANGTICSAAADPSDCSWRGSWHRREGREIAVCRGRPAGREHGVCETEALSYGLRLCVRGRAAMKPRVCCLSMPLYTVHAAGAKGSWQNPGTEQLLGIYELVAGDCIALELPGEDTVSLCCTW